MSHRHPPRALSVELRLQQHDLDIRAQFRVPPGRVCALVGRSGAGKSSLLKAAAGIGLAQGGRVALGAQPLYDSAANIDLPPQHRRLSWLDAHGHLFPHLNVRGNLLYGRPDLVSRRLPGPDLDRVTTWLNLSALLQRKPACLDAAQRVRVALGRALLANPNALLLDDPLGEVPESDREALLDLLAELPARYRLPVVIVSPRMDEVIRLADDIVILHEGQVASAGPTAQILSDVALSTFLEGMNAGSVLEGKVTRHDLNWLLSEVDVSGQQVTVPATMHPVGGKVRLKVRARDVSLHREQPTDSSATNHLRGRITQIMLAGEHGTYGAVSVALDHTFDSGSQHGQANPPLWAMLTRKAIEQMAWAPGQPCVLSFNAMSTRVHAWR